MCLFPEENQQPVLGSQRFSEEKWQFSLVVKQKTHFTEEINEKQFAKVGSSHNNFYSFRVINHSTTTTGSTRFVSPFLRVAFGRAQLLHRDRYAVRLLSWHRCCSWTRLMTPVVVQRQVLGFDRAENCGGSAVAVL